MGEWQHEPGRYARVSVRSGVVEDPRHTYKPHAREPGDLGNTTPCAYTTQYAEELPCLSRIGEQPEHTGITERKKAEEALRTSEERRRLAQEVAGIGAFERDVRTGRVTWAEGLDSLYGLPPGSVDGKTPAFFRDLIHPADRERVAHLIQEAMKTVLC